MGSMEQLKPQNSQVMKNLNAISDSSTCTVRFPQIIVNVATSSTAVPEIAKTLKKKKKKLKINTSLDQNDWEYINTNIYEKRQHEKYIPLHDKEKLNEINNFGSTEKKNQYLHQHYCHYENNSVHRQKLDKSPSIHDMTVDLHYNSHALQDVKKAHFLRSQQKDRNKVKRRHSEKILCQQQQQENPDYSTNQITCNERSDTIKICRSRSMLNSKRTDLPKSIVRNLIINDSTSKSDTFIKENIKKHKGSGVRVGASGGNKDKHLKIIIGDTKALIDKYMNPETVFYQSDLSFLYKDKSLQQVTQTIGRSFATTWNKRDRTKEELNMLDLGNTYYKRRKSEGDLSKACSKLKSDQLDSLSQSQNEGASENNELPSSFLNVSSKIKSSSKKVLFNEETTEILDIHEVEPPFDFAVRVGRVDVMDFAQSDSLTCPSLDSNIGLGTASQLKPILKRTGGESERENVNWDECYQYSSDDESDTSELNGSDGYRDYLRDTTNGMHRLSLPTLSSTGSMVYSPSPSSSSRGTPMKSVSPRLALDSRSRSRGSNSSNTFQCSKEFALVLQNLDSDEDES